MRCSLERLRDIKIRGITMTNIWIIWLVVSTFVITAVGLHKRFVTTKLSGKVVVVDRIPFKAVKYMVTIFTVVFALLLGGDNLFYTLADARFSFASNFWYWFLCRMPFVLFVVVVYRCALCFLYNYSRKENDKDVKDEILWRKVLKRG